MLSKRLIPCLLYDGVGLVKTVQFKKPSYIGDPINTIKLFNEKTVDELILLDINATKKKIAPNFEMLSEVTSELFVPLTYGGGVSSIEHLEKLFRIGIEKVSINSSLSDERFIKAGVKRYGSQSIVASVDFETKIFGGKKIRNIGEKYKNFTILEYCLYLQNDLGVGEILLQDVNREGTWAGLNYNFFKTINSKLKIPLIASGGTKDYKDAKNMLYDFELNAVAVGNLVVYSKKGQGVLVNYEDISI